MAKMKETYNKFNTLVKILEYISIKYTDDIAIRYLNDNCLVHISFNQLKVDSDILCEKLITLGITKRKIAFIGTAHYQWIVFYFGHLKAGNIVVPIELGILEGEMCDLINYAQVSIICYDKDEVKNIEYLIANSKVERGINFKAGVEGVEPINRSNENIDLPKADDIAMIVFTSGTTGCMKAVELTHQNIADNIFYSAKLLDDSVIFPKDQLLLILPIYHMFALTGSLLVPLFLGATICIANLDKDIMKISQIFKPTVMVVVPAIGESIYKNICSNGIEVIGGELRTLISGGAYNDPNMIDRYQQYGINFLVGYGITECSPIVSCSTPQKLKRGSVGIIMKSSFCDIKIVDNEIYIKGSIVMKGYYNDNFNTINSFRDEWFMTGDLGYIDKDKYLYITGRKKNLIILKNGKNVAPEEIEKRLIKYNVIKVARVYIEQIKNNLLLVAEVEINEEYGNQYEAEQLEYQLEEIRLLFNQQVPVYKRIYKIYISKNTLGVTALGKIKR